MPSKKKQPWPRTRIFEKFPALEELLGEDNFEVWQATFDGRPDAMHAILADIIKIAYADPGQVGQRPMPEERNVDTSWLLQGATNSLPIAEILPKLVKVSDRKFCQEIDMSRRMYQRMLAGEYDPDISQLRRIAKAVGRPPSFFVEYRRKMLATALASLLHNHPNIADGLYERFVVSQRRIKRSNGHKPEAPQGFKQMADAVTAIQRIAEQFNLQVAIEPTSVSD